MGFKHFCSSFTRRLRCFLADCSPSLLLTGAGVTLLAGAIVRAVSGSPYRHGVLLQYDALIPPVWLMSLLWMVWYALLGAAFVYLLCGGRCDGRGAVERYRGGMLFLGMLFLGFFWYPLFFAAGHTFLAALLLLGVGALCVACALCCWRAARAVSILLFVHAAFLLWMLVINLAVVFKG